MKNDTAAVVKALEAAKARIDQIERAASVPPGLVALLDKMTTWEPSDSPRAAAIKQAADVLRKLPTRQTDADRLDSPAFQSKGYRIDTDVEAKNLRLVMFGASDNKQVLSYTLLDTPEVYEFASKLLKSYDELEGIH